VKKSVTLSSNFSPQPLYLYGTYKEDNKPNFGLFGWFSFCWDVEIGVMACIGNKKLTKDRIKANKIFSANLVTEELLPIADYFGNKEGYSKDKMNVDVEIEKGHILDVPILTKSPFIFELEVDKTIVLNNSDVLLCKIRNILADELLCDDLLSVEKRINAIKPVHTVCQTYFSWDGSAICPWGKAMKNYMD
jgi:flavin reductase (DIM6/NTAB) family NADH-FMN oxidoreductase RutF